MNFFMSEKRCNIKLLNSSRLPNHFLKLWNSPRNIQYIIRKLDEADVLIPNIRNQNQTVITDSAGTPVSSLQLVNSLMNGKIQTVNSMKYHSRKIKETLGIDFKYHYLRHTYGTRLAEQNIPAYLLCNQMGHASSRVTEKYYIAISKRGTDIIKDKVEGI